VHELKFIKPFRLGRKIFEDVIPNGINLSRIKKRSCNRHQPFTFLSFGGRNIQKRVDLLMKAASELVVNGTDLEVLITEGTDTRHVVESSFARIPSWLKLVPQTDDVNSLFTRADCFVSASAHETFSYAVAEASIYGLPVVQSDIEGTQWNAGNPSAFLFPRGDVEGLKAAMLRAMDEYPQSLNYKCEITSAANRAAYSLEAWSKKVINFFESIP